MPASLEEAAKYAQTPHPEQRLPLSTYRSQSSIPRGNSDENPHHQLGSPDSSKWVYPSEQQVFNAMKRKGWQGVEEEAIPSFLQIHNSVNERSWRELCKWEDTNATSGIAAVENDKKVQLVRFQGRPQDLSPKAWFLSTFLFQDKPFDRHDWYIDNGVDHEKRYVLDFYMMEDKTSGIPRVDIDVRPALDTPQAFVQRGARLVKEMFPGITKELEKIQSSRKEQ
jgi:cytochrome c heme-lyase